MTWEEKLDWKEKRRNYEAAYQANLLKRWAARDKRLAEEAEAKKKEPKKRPSIEEIRAFTKEYGETLKEKKRLHDEEKKVKAEKKRKAMALFEEVNPDGAAYHKKVEAFKKKILGDQFSPEEQEFQAKSKEMHDEVKHSSDE